MPGSVRTQNENLKATVRALQAQAAAGGAPVEQHHISNVGHVLNLLQRPKSIVTRSFHNLFNADNVLNSLSAIPRAAYTSGISGKQFTGADLLSKDLGVKNKVALGVGGLGLDVALDPATYLTGGLAKGAEAPELAGEAISAGTKAIEAEKTGTGALNARRIRRLASRDIAREANLAGEDISTAEHAARTSKRTEEYISKKATEVGNKASQEGADKVIEKLGGPRVQIKFKVPGTKGEGRILTEIPLNKPYGGLSRAGKAFLNTEVGGSLGDAFSTTRLYTASGREKLRKFMNAGALGFEKSVHEYIAPTFKGLSKEDQLHVFNALSGKIDDAALAGLEGKNAAGQSLKEIKDSLRARWDQHFWDGVDRGIYKPEQFMENYVPMYFEKGGKNLGKALKARKGKLVEQVDASGNVIKDAKGASLMKTVPKYTFDEAKSHGLNPVEDLEKIAVMREAKHVSQHSTWQVLHALLSEHGIHIPDAVGAKWAMENGAVRVSQRTAGKYATSILDKIASEGNFAAKVEGNYYVPERVATALKNIVKLQQPEEASTLLKTIDKVQTPWKFMATAANPGHHFRNMLGDIWNNYLDGVVDPRHYEKAWTVLGRDIVPGRTAEEVLAARQATKIKAGVGEIHGQQALDLMGQSGGRSGMIRQEFGQEGKSLKGAVEKIREKGELREDMARFAHWTHAFDEEAQKLGLTQSELDAGYASKRVAAAADKASARVRKWNIDYGDLTPFEQRYMKRAIPFYTFMRKNAPLQMEALALRPGRVAMLPKAAQALQTTLTGDTSSTTSTDMLSQILPGWVQDTMHVKLRGEGEGHNSIYWLPSTPFEEATKYLGNPKQMLSQQLAGLSPILRMPIEEAYGRQLFGSQAPLKSGLQGQKEYLMQQVPITRTVLNLLQRSGGNKSSTVLGSKESWDQLMKYLTGSGVEMITPEEQRSELLHQRITASNALKSQRTARRKKAQGGR